MEELTAEKLKAFPLVVMAPTIDEVVPVAIQSAGIGPTRINTVLVNWPRLDALDTSSPEYQSYFRNLNMAVSLGCNLLIFDSDDAEWETLQATDAEQRVIDVWWRDNRTGRLMLVLAYLLTRNDSWRNAKIRLVVRAASSDASTERLRAEEILKDVRISGEVEIVDPVDDQPAQFMQVSAESSIVFMALGFRRNKFVDWLGNEVTGILPLLPICVLAMAAEEVDLSADPDEGEEGTRAAAKDTFDDAVERRDAAARELKKSVAKLEKASKSTSDELAADQKTDLAGLSAEVETHNQKLSEAEKSLANARLVAENLGLAIGDSGDDGLDR